MTLEGLEAENEWFAYTSPPERAPLPPAKSSPLSSPLSPPPPLSPPCYPFFPSASKEVEFGTAITTVIKSIISEAIDKVKEDTPTGEGKGKRRADIDDVADEGREAKRMVLSSG